MYHIISSKMHGLPMQPRYKTEYRKDDWEERYLGSKNEQLSDRKKSQKNIKAMKTKGSKAEYCSEKCSN